MFVKLLKFSTTLELRAASLVICELWATTQPVCELITRLWVSVVSVYSISSWQCQSTLFKVCIAVKWYDIFQLLNAPESNRKIHCDLNGNKLEKYATVHSKRNDCSTDFGKSPKEQLRWSTNLVQLQTLQFY